MTQAYRPTTPAHAARRQPQAFPLPSLSRFESWALVVLALVTCGLSGGMLWAVGINYDGITGSAAQKVHPATYLAVFLFGWTMLRAGNPVIPMAAAAERRPASVLLCLVGFGLLAFIASRNGTGLAGSLDTYVLTGLVVILMADRDAITMRHVEIVVHAVMVANAALGLVEFVSGQRFFPFRMDGQAFDTDTRSAALQGHPLANATLTACYILALFNGGGQLRPITRAGFITLQLVALITFGGRSATVVTLCFGSVFAVVALNRALRTGRVPLLGAAIAVLMLTMVPIVVGGLAVGGFFDALLERFVSDGGSANARVEMLAIFDAIPFRDLLVGPDPSIVDTLRRMYGLEWGIENPIVRSLLYNGVAMTVLLIVAIALFLYEVARQCRHGVFLPILAFVVLINTFESIGGKTTLLAKFALMLLVLYPRRPLSASPSPASSGPARR
ncbi:VpsF family polysaccharide biosynthesis protein [Methylobacterium sp. J-059]|uniref:VpsF family polysaccharide biosynthesis protein n=1 Tax=Methylobacterium sp. J-059 TaxID=2836643 RepID=UPI001FBC0172|nr:VpsF family polysaccharide biosynthesis protein [Methylobacterium sp. J-059]MCJ2038034.1 VpsF family polysaccharide biosynthesis protein [Methylobacterium sp. J-059]